MYTLERPATLILLSLVRFVLWCILVNVCGQMKMSNSLWLHGMLCVCPLDLTG